MIVTDELLLSLADGELDAPTAAKLRQAIAASPDLQASYAVFEESSRLLREALDPGPVPERLIAAINAAPGAASPEGSRAARATPPAEGMVIPFNRRRLAAKASVFAAIAASLVLGIAIGSYPDLSDRPVSAPDLLTYATLPTGAAQQNADGSTIRVLGSYQTDAGLCREILTETARHLRHDLLCKAEGVWQQAFSITAPAAQGYLPASDALTAGIDGFLNAIGAGSALDPTDEEAALASP